MKYFYFYKITNKINGKFYYGVHATSKIEDGYFGSGIALNQAIQKYGKENFIKENLEFFNSKEEMYDYEKNFITIDFLESNRNVCYNIKEGGNGGFRLANEAQKRYAKEDPNYYKKRKSKFENMTDIEKSQYLSQIGENTKEFWENLRSKPVEYKAYIEKHRQQGYAIVQDTERWNKFLKGSKNKWEEKGYKEEVHKLRTDRNGSYYKRFKQKYDSLKDTILFLCNTSLSDEDIVSCFNGQNIELSFKKVIPYFESQKFIEVKSIEYIKDFSTKTFSLKRKTLIKNSSQSINISLLKVEAIEAWNKLNEYLIDESYSDSSFYKLFNYKSIPSLLLFIESLGFITNLRETTIPSNIALTKLKGKKTVFDFTGKEEALVLIDYKNIGLLKIDNETKIISVEDTGKNIFEYFNLDISNVPNEKV